MATKTAKTARRRSAEKPKLERVKRPPRRDGPRRAKNLIFVDALLKRLEVHAASRGLDVAEVLMRWIEQHLPATPRKRRQGRGEAAAVEPAEAGGGE